ncbi:hypothetical protein IVA87_27485 [Bradyrhizobium sp. 147]|uniref:DUF6527 family protein n=1 Tax=unclassified Bradyrhizobium TaxID=2631580 RepID=UPI001FFB9346|nr:MULTISPECIES: DUF6527 family protein [unclassified Bradyrhizobium]MCK1626900.1 hypothetical protein [Bradyrhizobium sp. 160]MCK1683037.1 hypothetical protein [Bradyrhizobium sp. 147]
MISFSYRAVERLPKQLEQGVLYHSPEFEVAALSCACGCGHRVMLLVPDSHQVSQQNGFATVQPSISVCDAPCKSHYIITSGEVQWLASFSDAMASATMRGQIARHVGREARLQTWTSWIRMIAARAFGRLRQVLRM